jgi:hypothetical protein
MRRSGPPLPRFARIVSSGFALVGFILIGAAGCDDDNNQPVDHDPPAIPRGVTSITGDEAVTILWYPNMEWDLSGYRIYRNLQPAGTYQRIAWVDAGHHDYWASYVDEHLSNGTTYFYAVSAVDFAGNESDLSLEEVRDTPRPEGWGLRLSSYQSDASRCAYDFSRFFVTDYDDPAADIAFVFTHDSGGFMIGLNEPGGDIYTELQDAGYHEMDDVTWAPPEGWSPSAEVELVVGHVYVAWTRDDHYAKFRVILLAPAEVVIDWAYQVAPGNQELKQAAPPRPVHAEQPMRVSGGAAR